MFTARSPAVSGSGLLPSTTSVHGTTPRRYLDCVVSTLRHPLTILRRRWPGNRSTVSVDLSCWSSPFTSKVIVDSRTARVPVASESPTSSLQLAQIHFLGALVDTVWQSNTVTSAARNTRYWMHRPAPDEAALWHGFNHFTLSPRILWEGQPCRLLFLRVTRPATFNTSAFSRAHTRSNFFGRVELRTV